MKRRLFSILWVSSLLIFVLLGALWVRSYWCWDSACYDIPDVGGGSVYLVMSSRGLLCLSYNDNSFYLATGPVAISTGLETQTATSFRQVNRWGFAVSSPFLSRLVFPHWLPMLAAGILPTVSAVRASKRRRRQTPGLCVKCGYDLRASKERCPECGTAIAAQAGTKRGRK